MEIRRNPPASGVLTLKANAITLALVSRVVKNHVLVGQKIIFQKVTVLATVEQRGAA